MKMTRLKLNGLTRRWVVNVLSVIFVVIFIIEVVLILVANGTFVKDIEQYLNNQLDTVTTFFANYSSKSVADFESGAREYVESFTERDKMEVQILNSQGVVIMSTSGFMMPETEDTSDYDAALFAQDKTATWSGNRPASNEAVMTAVGIITAKENTGLRLGAIRIMVSMTDANRQFVFQSGVIAVFGFALFLFVLVSGVYFIRSIITPIRNISQTARQIAMGDFEARIESKFKDDEVGHLCDTINYMAGELGSTEKMKNEFISSVSHELRTPLTAIKGWGETVLASPEDPVITKKGIEVMIGEAERLSVIVEDLLDFSRLQNGQLSYNIQPCDVIAELSEAVLTLTDTARRNEINLDFSENVQLPPILGDAVRLQQVFVNIIDNAIKYTPKGGTIIVDATLHGGYVLIMISDNGCGIPEQELEHVKQKFYKCKNATRGSGIGLAVADEIIQKHGGLLDIASTEHVGTTVSITLPLAPAKPIPAD